MVIAITFSQCKYVTLAKLRANKLKLISITRLKLVKRLPLSFAPSCSIHSLKFPLRGIRACVFAFAPVVAIATFVRYNN